ncbi:MAG: hypothetical protein BA870_03325 [Desulfuromonadales bacterium C00003094]|nr:MAG: hypothetical protein BA870_03325 [Desulfuromonadales bacterium C00003094]OEU77562.1 MAG: hypothetical protein BA869_02905 [Desulfuromonadales bacterium C00003107]
MLTKIKRIDAACQPPTQPASRRESLGFSRDRLKRVAEVSLGIKSGEGNEEGHPIDLRGVPFATWAYFPASIYIYRKPFICRSDHQMNEKNLLYNVNSESAES